MLRKKRLKCESISARLFLACHQKFNAFKCKQFCYAKPTLAHLLAGGFAPRPRERRAAVHSLCYSVGSSAHSPVNSLRSNSTDSCGLLRKPFPRGSQTASTTAARLLEACSSVVIKSLTLLFCVFSQASQARPCVRLRKSDSGLNANPLPPKRFYLMLTLWFISQPVPKNRPTETRSWKMTPVTPKERSFADIEDPNENISPFSPGDTIMGT